MRKKLYLLLLCVLWLSACGANSPESPSLQGAWKLVEYGSAGSMTPAVEDAVATLSFGDDGTVTGSGGCNSLGGDYEVKGDEITFGPIVSTLMACGDPRDSQERFVTQVLTDSVQYELEDGTLTITNNDRVLVFSK